MNHPQYPQRTVDSRWTTLGTSCAETVDDTAPVVDSQGPSVSHRWWTNRGQLVENGRDPWKHHDVISSAGDERPGRPHMIHRTKTQADLQKQPIIHTFHTPYEDHEISSLSLVFRKRCAQLHG